MHDYLRYKMNDNSSRSQNRNYAILYSALMLDSSKSKMKDFTKSKLKRPK